MRRLLAGVLLSGLALAGCGEQPAEPRSDEPGAEPGSTPDAADRTAELHPDAIWFEVAGVSREADGQGEILPAGDAGELTPLWRRHRFDGEPPGVDFDQHIVLVVTRPEDGCPDELVEARMRDGELTFTWLPPPGPCTSPLIPTAFAVVLHRGDLPERFTVLQPEHEGHGGDVRAEIELPPYDGPPAPEPSPPPRAMRADELDAVFAGHALRRCDEMPDYGTTPEVDGPVSDDPEIAEIQRRRAEFALPSDEARARELRDNPEANRAFGFPMTEAEFDEIMNRNRPEFGERFQTEYVVEHADTYGFSLIDQAAGGVMVVGFTDDLDGHRERLAARFPDLPIRVVQAVVTQQRLQAAQEELHRQFTHDGSPAVLHSGAGGTHLTIGVLDPTREDLDAIAGVVDPAWSCVDPVLSGLRDR